MYKLAIELDESVNILF